MINTNNNTLLSQREIDTLIRFLTNHTERLQDSVLSQDSIDKLITLLQNGNVNINMSTLSGSSDDLIAAAATDDLSGYSLSCVTDKASGFVSLIAKKAGTENIEITPSALSTLKLTSDGSVWGYFIEPVIFDKIAAMFHAGYSKEEYDNVCRIFAAGRYGDKNAKIPAFYLPSTEALSANML